MNYLLYPCRNPATNEFEDYVHIRSVAKGGAGTGIIGIDDLYVPNTPNFPDPYSVNGATRYFIYLDYNIDITDLNNRPVSIKNETKGVELTLVTDVNSELTNYQCRIYPATSLLRNLIEVHVGASSSSAGDKISIEAYADSSVINTYRAQVLYNYLPVRYSKTSPTGSEFVINFERNVTRAVKIWGVIEVIYVSGGYYNVDFYLKTNNTWRTSNYSQQMNYAYNGNNVLGAEWNSIANGIINGYYLNYSKKIIFDIEFIKIDTSTILFSGKSGCILSANDIDIEIFSGMLNITNLGDMNAIDIFLSPANGNITTNSYCYVQIIE